MKFEIGHFYQHESGRSIAVLSEVETYAWGRMFVIEEADESGGHFVSAMHLPAPGDEELVEGKQWIEIGKTEWLKHFQAKICGECGRQFVEGDMIIKDGDQMLHQMCFSQRVQQRGPENIESINLQPV